MTDLEKEFVQLSWWILEQKYIYYHGYNFDGAVHPSWIKHHAAEDHEYDEAERRYEFLADILGKNPTATDMVGFNKNRPCCELVMAKLAKPFPENMLIKKAAQLFG